MDKIVAQCGVLGCWGSITFSHIDFVVYRQTRHNHSHLYENKSIVKTKIRDFYAKNKATVGDPSTLVENFISTIPLCEKNLLPKRKSMVDYVNKLQNHINVHTFHKYRDLPDAYTRTQDGFNFIFYYEEQDVQDRIIIFGSSKHRTFLREAETLKYLNHC